MQELFANAGFGDCFLWRQLITGYQTNARGLPLRNQNGECVDRMPAISFRDAVVTIVQQNNVAASRIAKVADDSLRRFFLPVLAPSGPHYRGIETGAVQCRGYLRPTGPEWGTHPSRIVADGVGDRVAAGFQFGPNAPRRLEREDRVGVGMVADGVSGSGNPRSQVRKLTNTAADQEKRGANIVEIEQIQKLRSRGGIRSVIEGERHGLGITGAADGWTEQLRVRKKAAPGPCASNRGKCGGGELGDRWRVHILDFRMMRLQGPVRLDVSRLAFRTLRGTARSTFRKHRESGAQGRDKTVKPEFKTLAPPQNATMRCIRAA